ncbi:MAG: methyltransferase domain-containing protein [Anaerolineae bacterium]|nr:methyltransferase domain-containing protein [Anaerolineae bacterium]
MWLAALNYWVCPACRGSLTLAESINTEGNQVLQGTLKCSACATLYPIIRGVPRLLPSNATADLLTGAAYKHFFDSVAPSGSAGDDVLYGNTLSDEITDFLKKTGLSSLAALQGALILDAGCGIGRIDGALAEHAGGVLAFDITPAVEQAFVAWKDRPTVHIAQASMTAIPIADGTIDLAWCDGVLPYVSDFEQSLRELLRTRAVNGRLYTWSYDEIITLKERIGRGFHNLNVPMRLRYPAMLGVATVLSSAASVYRRKNLVKNAPHFAQGMYDWSLATGVNHVTVGKVRSLVGTIPDSQVSNNGRRVEIRIGL